MLGIAVVRTVAPALVFFAAAAHADDLAGSSWQLVAIQSMDDSVLAPEIPWSYTLEFARDGSVAIKADCNRAQGTWQSRTDGDLSFGPMPATLALCPPPSISEDFLAQLGWVRSYVVKDSNLFLATMADRSIIEFAPLPPVTATVLGQEVRSLDPFEMQAFILKRLFDKYADEHGITAQPDEVNAMLAKLREGREASSTADMSSDDLAKLDAMETEMVASLVTKWKIDRALYAAYGGRIIYQQLGPEPLDAYRTFLKQTEADGDFTIKVEELSTAFWDYFTDDERHDFMPAGSPEANDAFSTPPWKR